MENLNLQSPKVVELSFRVLEKIIMAVKFDSKEELIDIATQMKDKAQEGDYPQEMKLAYEEAINKINSLSIEQIKELHDIISE